MTLKPRNSLFLHLGQYLTLLLNCTPAPHTVSASSGKLLSAGNGPEVVDLSNPTIYVRTCYSIFCHISKRAIKPNIYRYAHLLSDVTAAAGEWNKSGFMLPIVQGSIQL